MVPTFKGDNYRDWSKKMEQLLDEQGFWHLVEEGYNKPNTSTGELSAEEIEELKQDIANDAKALSLIHQSLSPNIFMKICDATTTKQAWNALHAMFHDKKDKMKEPLNAPENESASKTARTYDNMSESVHVLDSEDETSTEFVKNSSDATNEGDDGVTPLSGDKPFFDMVIAKSAVKPLCHMNFPNRVNSLLPSTNVVAKVRFFGKVYKIYFYGTRKQKSFGSGWRQLVEEHNPAEGDFLVFEILKSNSSELKINLQLLRWNIPPELEEKIRMKKAEPTTVTDIDDDDDINIDDDDGDDDNIDFDNDNDDDE